MVRVAETPRRVHMNKRRTPKGRFFNNFLNYSCMNNASKTEAQLLAFYKRYSEQLLDQLADAHKTIGGLRYYLEINNIELPKHLAPKKKEETKIEVTTAKSILKNFCLN